LIRTDSKAHKVNELRKLVTNGITLASLNATIENIKKIENRTLIHSPAAGGMTPIYIPNNIPTSKVTVYGKLILYRDLYLKALNQDQQMQNKKI
jgi:hypothetical protein